MSRRAGSGRRRIRAGKRVARRERRLVGATIVVFHFGVGDEFGDGVFVFVATLVEHGPALNVLVFFVDEHFHLEVLSVFFLGYHVDLFAEDTALGFVLEVEVFEAFLIDLVDLRGIYVFGILIEIVNVHFFRFGQVGPDGGAVVDHFLFGQYHAIFVALHGELAFEFFVHFFYVVGEHIREVGFKSGDGLVFFTHCLQDFQRFGVVLGEDIYGQKEAEACKNQIFHFF